MIGFWKHSAKPSERSGRRTTSQTSFVLLCLFVLGCSSPQKIERRQGDRIERGRRVPPRAYAWYARARYLHRAGELELARDAYEAVLAEDPSSGAAFAGLGSTYCSDDEERAQATFSRGLRRAVESLPIYLARGRCELAWGQSSQALASARQAFARNPTSSEANALLVDALAASGAAEEAARVARGQKLYARQGESSPPVMATQAAVDLALAREDYALAESLSLELMSKSELSARAFALGKWDFAEEQAALISAAAPDDQQAWAVLALTRNDAMRGLPADGAAPGELISCLWTEHLRAAVGLIPSELFLIALGFGGATATMQRWSIATDPLLSACAERLRRASSALARPATTSDRP
jgi:hypothetical protein